MNGTEVKLNLGELYKRVKEVHARRMRKVLSGVTRKVVCLRNFLVWLEDGRDKQLNVNMLTLISAPIKGGRGGGIKIIEGFFRTVCGPERREDMNGHYLEFFIL